MNTFLIILVIALLWGVGDLLRKASSGSTSSELLTFIFNLGATISPLIILAYLAIKKTAINYSMNPIILSLFAGILVGIGGVLLFNLLSKGQAVSIAFPAIRVLSLLVVTIGGFLLFSEPISFKIIVGLILSLAGVFILLVK